MRKGSNMDADKDQWLAAFLAKAKARKASEPQVPIVEGEVQIRMLMDTLEPVITHAAKIFVGVILDPDTQHLLLTDEGHIAQVLRACRIAWEVHHGLDPKAEIPMGEQEAEEFLAWFLAHNASVQNVAISLGKHVRKLEQDCVGGPGTTNRRALAKLDEFMADAFGDFDPHRR